MRNCITVVALLAAFSSTANAALTHTIDFSELPDVTNLMISSPYTDPSGEFSITSAGFFGTVGSSVSESYSGSTALHKVVGGTITLARVDAAVFSLTSIDLAELTTFTTPTPHSVMFTGQLAGGGSTTQTFTLDAIVGAPPAPQTFLFDPLFENITSVAWAQSGGTGTTQFDNIAVGVPEPTSLLLLASTLCATTLVRRRRA